MRLHVDQRHERVLELVRERGSLRVAELASELGVSAVTLRRDVEALAAQGRVQRLHGAVVWPGGQASEAPVQTPAAEGAVIGMIVPTTNFIFADIVRGARETVEAQGGRLVLGMSGYLDTEDPVQAEHLLAGGAEGLLIAPSWFGGVPADGQEKWLLECPVPTVLVERTARPAIPPQGSTACARTGRTARGGGGSLREAGAPGGRGGTAGRTARRADRRGISGRDGVARADARAGIAGDQGTRRVRRDSAVPGRRGQGTGVTAALVHSDEDAIVLVPRLQERGINVPSDLALIAYDDEVAGLSDVPLTAVAPPKRAVGELAAKLMLQRLAERASGRTPTPRQHLELLPELRVRASCGAGEVSSN